MRNLLRHPVGVANHHVAQATYRVVDLLFHIVLIKEIIKNLASSPNCDGMYAKTLDVFFSLELNYKDIHKNLKNKYL